MHTMLRDTFDLGLTGTMDGNTSYEMWNNNTTTWGRKEEGEKGSMNPAKKVA